MKFLPVIIACLCLPIIAFAQNPLARTINDNKAAFGLWATNPDKYEVQVLYTEIDRRADGTVSLKTHHWGTDSTQYFYPASTVKKVVPTNTANTMSATWGDEDDEYDEGYEVGGAGEDDEDDDDEYGAYDADGNDGEHGGHYNDGNDDEDGDDGDDTTYGEDCELRWRRRRR